jgi:hypothetical protein
MTCSKQLTIPTLRTHSKLEIGDTFGFHILLANLVNGTETRSLAQLIQITAIRRPQAPLTHCKQQRSQRNIIMSYRNTAAAGNHVQDDALQPGDTSPVASSKSLL